MLYIFIYTIFLLLPVIFFPIKKKKKALSQLLSESGCRLLYLKHEPTEQVKSCELSIVADGHSPAGSRASLAHSHARNLLRALSWSLKGGHWLKPMYHSVNISQ